MTTEGTVTTGFITVDLPPTGVEGQILLDIPPSTPLAMARVYVRGSGECL